MTRTFDADPGHLYGRFGNVPVLNPTFDTLGGEYFVRNASGGIAYTDSTLTTPAVLRDGLGNIIPTLSTNSAGAVVEYWVRDNADAVYVVWPGIAQSITQTCTETGGILSAAQDAATAAQAALSVATTAATAAGTAQTAASTSATAAAASAAAAIDAATDPTIPDNSIEAVKLTDAAKATLGTHVDAAVNPGGLAGTITVGTAGAITFATPDGVAAAAFTPVVYASSATPVVPASPSLYLQAVDPGASAYTGIVAFPASTGFPSGRFLPLSAHLPTADADALVVRARVPNVVALTSGTAVPSGTTEVAKYTLTANMTLSVAIPSPATSASPQPGKIMQTRFLMGGAGNWVVTPDPAVFQGTPDCPFTPAGKLPVDPTTGHWTLATWRYDGDLAKFILVSVQRQDGQTGVAAAFTPNIPGDLPAGLVLKLPVPLARTIDRMDAWVDAPPAGGPVTCNATYVSHLTGARVALGTLTFADTVGVRATLPAAALSAGMLPGDGGGFGQMAKHGDHIELSFPAVGANTPATGFRAVITDANTDIPVSVAAPGAPSALYATRRTSDAQLLWTAPAAGRPEQVVDIYRNTGSGNVRIATGLTTTGSLAVPWTDVDYNPSISTTYSLYARNIDGCSTAMSVTYPANVFAEDYLDALSTSDWVFTGMPASGSITPGVAGARVLSGSTGGGATTDAVKGVIIAPAAINLADYSVRHTFSSATSSGQKLIFMRLAASDFTGSCFVFRVFQGGAGTGWQIQYRNGAGSLTQVVAGAGSVTTVGTNALGGFNLTAGATFTVVAQISGAPGAVRIRFWAYTGATEVGRVLLFDGICTVAGTSASGYTGIDQTGANSAGVQSDFTWKNTLVSLGAL